jgi:hypothetical protein
MQERNGLHMVSTQVQEYVRIIRGNATASMVLSFQSLQPVQISIHPHYIEICDSPIPSYIGSAVSFPSTDNLHTPDEELQIKGHIKVRIRNIQTNMEWN